MQLEELIVAKLSLKYVEGIDLSKTDSRYQDASICQSDFATKTLEKQKMFLSPQPPNFLGLAKISHLDK
jgi:hypothetical protein